MDFFSGFISATFLNGVACFLSVALVIGMLKMGIDLIFPQQSIYRKSVYLIALMLTALLILNDNGVSLVTVNQYLPTGGVG